MRYLYVFFAVHEIMFSNLNVYGYNVPISDKMLFACNLRLLSQKLLKTCVFDVNIHAKSIVVISAVY